MTSLDSNIKLGATSSLREGEIVTSNTAILDTAEASFGHRFLWWGTARLVNLGIAEPHPEFSSRPVRRQIGRLNTPVGNAENEALSGIRPYANFVWSKRTALKNSVYLCYKVLDKVVYLLLRTIVIPDLHAALVNSKAEAFCLCGELGSGESTLSYASARAGWIHTSNWRKK